MARDLRGACAAAPEAETRRWKMKVERISAAGSINFDQAPDQIVEDIKRAARDDCAWCGAECDERGSCSANCEASRRVARKDVRS